MLFYRFLKKHSHMTELAAGLYVLENTFAWFLIGAVAVWIVGKLLGISTTGILTGMTTIGPLLALTVGYIGSVLALMHKAE